MLSSIFFIITLLVGILSNENVRVSLFNEPVIVLTGIHFDLISRVEPDELEADSGITIGENTVIAKYGEWSYCDYIKPDSSNYSVSLESVTVDPNIEKDEIFMVDMAFKNTSNTRIFSAESGCSEVPVFNVGTQNSQDRNSLFGGADYAISGWANPRRVKMSESFANPDQSFHVVFQSLAPNEDNIYREFFQPVIENEAWISDVFGVEIPVGTPTDEMENNIQYVSNVSMSAKELEGLTRSLEITLSDQMMYARFGETRVWSMQISSGAGDTPTPRGDYQVLSKQELRIGGKWPHYRMPYFQMWDSRGYGIHALPYLATDGGTFWSEALTHIGTPVSHGCIRTLSEDAITLYSFTDIGTPVWIH
ncbi:MAG: L,D-transpeptidase [Candidatus Gracilibacteria bacterium]